MRPSLVQSIVSTPAEIDASFWCQKGRVYTFLNPVSYLDALRHKDLFVRFDGIFVDGSILAAAIKMIYGRKVERRSFDMTSVAPMLFEHAQKKGKTVYIVASQQEQVEKAVKIFEARYPDIQIIGCRNGYFHNEEEQKEAAANIAALNPDFLIVGMGVVMQERFLLRAKGAGFQGIGFTCGGFIHQTAKEGVDYYPAWVDRMNLRFLYRMYREPHTRMRYAKAGLVFPAKFIWERIFG